MMKSNATLNALAAAAIAFGVITILTGAVALFGGDGLRASFGNAVGFVLWFNFLAGFAYVLVGAMLWLGRRRGTGSACLLALATALVAGVFGLHVMNGGAYEMRTAAALAIRLVFWIAVSAVALRTRHTS